MRTSVIYFSPTGTTKLICEAIAQGMGGDAEVYDITPCDSEVTACVSDGAAVIGVPVYGGRVPLISSLRIKDIKGAGIPAVVVAVYGNRDYEDALLELSNIVSEAGFNVIAGGAFIGEHSYATPEKPIAKGRPDVDDIARAKQFGADIKEKLVSGCTDTPKIRGNMPYRDAVSFKGIAPETDNDKCMGCGICLQVCPTGAVTVDAKSSSDPEKCVTCCACVKKCPSQAKRITHATILERTEMLYTKCSARKEPELFI